MLGIALDRFCYKVDCEQSEAKYFVTIFSHSNLLNKHFFSITHELTVYFFHKKLNKLFIFHYLLNKLKLQYPTNSDI